MTLILDLCAINEFDPSAHQIGFKWEIKNFI